MSCTCAKNIYPCPIHGEQGLPVCETVHHSSIIVRLHRRRRWRKDDGRWAADGKWFMEITVDAMHVFTGSDRENARDAMLEATCKLNSLYQDKPNQPKEK